jgi:hypothetical protein
MEHYKVEYAVDDNCIIIEGSDEDIQGILEYVKSVITEEEFTNGNVVALIGEMNLSGEKDLHGVSYGMSLNDISKKFGVSVDELSKELNMGIDVEMEHTKNDKLAKKIAMDHLSEFGTGYYTHLKQMENQLNRKNSTKPNNGR